MTYEQAKRWLAKIGGEQAVVREDDTFDAVVVRVTSAKGPELSRRALFQAGLTDYRREMAYREALVRACDELMRALA